MNLNEVRTPQEYEEWKRRSADKLNAQRHPSSARLHALLAEIGALHDRKQQDYGTAEDPFANVRASTEWGMPSWVGCMVRATDKIRRLQTFAKTGKLSNEGAKDSLQDIAVYALIAIVLMEEERGLSEKEKNKAVRTAVSVLQAGCLEPRPFGGIGGLNS